MVKAGKAVYDQSTDMNGLLRNISVSGDGAWQKRGYSSLNGVMTLISGGKCVDVEVLSKKCKQCEHWESKKETDECLEWKESHECSINKSFEEISKSNPYPGQKITKGECIGHVQKRV